jgi:UTP--glucose-1-phosphate uridylyltransferase
MSTVAVMEVPQEDVEKYGIVAAEKTPEGHFRVHQIVEKPPRQKAPSRLALPGRYIFTHHIFEYLKDAKPGKNGEIQLTDAMTELAKHHGLLASLFNGRRFDAGDKLGYLVANIELALLREDLGPQLKSYLRALAERL